MITKSSKKTSNKTLFFTKEHFIQTIFWFPVYVTVIVLPFVTHYKLYYSRLYGKPYYIDDIYNYEFSLYYKQIVFFFITGTTILMLTYFLYKNRKNLKYSFRKQCGILIPLSIYLILAFLSSVCSDYKYSAFTGSDGLFQSFWALFGYVVLVAYLSLLIKTEKDFKLAAIALILGSVFQAILGVLQYAGLNLYDYNWYQELITPKGYLEAVGPVINQMSNMVSLCTNNPNYAGVLLAVLSSFCFGVLLTEKKPMVFGLELLLLVALLISLIGTDSAAGILIFGMVVVIALVFRLFDNKKRRLLFLAATSLLGIGFLVVAQFSEFPITKNLKEGFSLKKQESNPLSRMVTSEKGIEITYLDVPFTIYVGTSGESYYFIVQDEFGEEIPLYMLDDKKYYLLEHDFLGNGVVKIQTGIYESMPLLLVYMNEQQWRFVKLNDEYYFINPYLHLEPLQEVKRIGFWGYERLATNRGLIWSQTLPLLNGTLFLGVGANNFVHLYPQNNYKDIYYYFGTMQVITKPHNIYLQTAIESGVVSLVSLLVFWSWYLIQSVKIYWNCQFDRLSKRIGFGCMLAVLAYLGCGLTNDSMISVAPIFWCIQGVGLSANWMNRKY